MNFTLFECLAYITLLLELIWSCITYDSDIYLCCNSVDQVKYKGSKTYCFLLELSLCLESSSFLLRTGSKQVNS